MLKYTSLGTRYSGYLPVCLYLPIINSVITNVYRPPSCEESLFQEALRDISTAIDSVGSPMPMIIMCGDFNFPFVDWSSGSVTGSTLAMQRQAESLINHMDEYCLQQCITEPTRMNNILDLFMTNYTSIIC